jgi:hypothetical protein
MSLSYAPHARKTKASAAEYRPAPDHVQASRSSGFWEVAGFGGSPDVRVESLGPGSTGAFVPSAHRGRSSSVPQRRCDQPTLKEGDRRQAPLDRLSASKVAGHSHSVCYRTNDRQPPIPRPRAKRKELKATIDRPNNVQPSRLHRTAFAPLAFENAAEGDIECLTSLLGHANEL